MAIRPNRTELAWRCLRSLRQESLLSFSLRHVCSDDEFVARKDINYVIFPQGRMTS